MIARHFAGRLRVGMRGVAFCASTGFLGFAFCVWLMGCGAAPSGVVSSNGGATSSSNDGSGNGASSNGGSESGVSTGGTEGAGTSGKPMPLDSIVQARVRNESSSGCDVTMRFLHDGSVVNLSFVRVPPKTVTTVSSPEMANEVELSGSDETGRELESEMFVFGVDFDSGTPAEYVVRDPSEAAPPEDATASAATLTLTEPSALVTRAVGSTLGVSWSDFGGGPAALVRLYLRPVGNNTPSQWTAIGSAISAQFDGFNDSLTTVVPSVKSGLYEVAGQLQNGGVLTTAVAPGHVKVVVDPRNAAPSLTILSPTPLTMQELTSEDTAKVTWKSVDPRQTGVIRFSLERSDGTGTAVGRFVIGPPMAATVHTAGRGSASLPVKGVLPGLYDLVGAIDDGRFTGSSRVERAVRVLPGVDNDAPQLTVSKPAANVEIGAGGSFLAAWKDSDANNDARISFYLDSDLGAVALDGNEQLLQTGVREDPDGSGDKLELLTPAGLAVGTYRVVGVITDGMTQVVTRAPGLVKIRAALPLPALPPKDSKPVDSGTKDETPSPVVVGGSSPDKSEGGATNPAPPGGGGSSGGTEDPKKDEDDKDEDPGKDDDGKPDDPGKDPGDPVDPDKNAEESDGIVVVIPEGALPSDRVTPSPEVPGEVGETWPRDEAPDPGIVVLIPDVDLPTDRVTPPLDIPGASGDVRPRDEGTENPGSRDVVVMIPNAELPVSRTSPAGEVIGDTGSTRPRGPGGIGLVASNTRFGGSTTVDVTPDGWTGRGTDVVGGEVRIAFNAIPNDAWPRTFDVVLSDSTRMYAVTSKPIIVPQAVGILDVSVGGVSCAGGLEGSTAAVSGVRITWFGGGTVDASEPATVEFWLSADATVPADGLDDKTHRRITVATGSPNSVRQTEFDWRGVLVGHSTDRGASLAESPALVPGQYRVVAVARFADFGDITTIAASGVVPVCEP